MDKKSYLQPNCKAITLETSTMIAISGTGATVPDAGWGDAKRRNGLEIFEIQEMHDEESIDE